ncbi:MAG: response regulator transcription factor [Ignavibacteriaceae bacterium]|nr:MAG: DNA-binding response regulator [Chlorobiota bacterium]MBV6398076.1 Response regulator UvrY [Ignavibacteria bacterium]MCC6886525.1 response regulator transcription factor [Ignavibacteriales bacterium]MCE7952399.1 DNA-binding response regulator [Chlorobi bacterium CHB7]MDL1886516.1 response regulator transcription factor [Ignavibacteria bacterium CHB1]MEB2329765.1 response regulator transcription factor [Ignavibacteriaceae bacterium]RIK48966.1 MAG: DNA-binding response regulator [Ignavi
MIRVIVADDHNLMREGIKKIIDQEPGIEVIGEASDSFELFEILDRTDCDILLLDISMPGKSGIEILKYLKGMKKNFKTIVLTMHPEDRFAIRSIKSGALGYLTKETAPEELVIAIRKVYNGGKYITEKVAELLMQDITHDPNDLPLHQLLSDREFEVLVKIASGKKINEISTELGISPATVNTYRSRLLEKLGLKSNVELTRFALEKKIIE